MSRLAALEPANGNASETPTWRMPECPSPDVVLPKHDERVSTLDVVASDHMDVRHYDALLRRMQANEVTDTKTAADSGVRRKRSQ